MILKDPISDKDIERSLWLINNRKKINKIIAVILILICVILYTISIFGFIKYFTEKDVSLDDFISVDFSKNKQTPQDIIIQDKQIVSRGNGKYDVVITLQNPNEYFGAEKIKYQLIINNILQKEETTFLLPQETKKIISLGIDSDTNIEDIDISLLDTNWKRIKQSEITNFTQKVFEIKDQTLNINTEDESLRNWIEFKAQNISPYNLKNNKFYVFLYAGAQIVAVNEIDANYFKSNEERKLQTSWYYMLPSYATAEIQYETNLFDDDNYFLEN